jgi:hypothetical protein
MWRKTMAVDVFGFPVSTGGEGGEFTPVLKYDARAGRFFRVERVNTGNGFENDDVDITQTVKFLADFENVEVGYARFVAGQAPDFHLVPMGSQLPAKPSEQHNSVVRFMLKLAKECGGERPIREISGASKAFRGAIEAVYTQYLAEKSANPDKLPVLVCEKITPVKTGTGTQSSTNYHPTFKIVGWSERKDLVFVAKAVTPSQASQVLAATAAAPATAPSTGSTRAEVPKAAEPAMADDDFG